MIYSMTEIEARYQETDKMGVIYHGNYATWFEVARTDYIRKLGFNYADMEKVGIISPITDLNVQYKKSVFYPETVKIKTWVEKYSRLRSTYRYEVYKENGELATTGYTELICMKADTFKPIRLDRYFPDWHETYSKVEKLNKNNIDLEIKQSSDIENL